MSSVCSIRKGFRYIEVKDGKVNPYNSFATPRFNRIAVSVQFPPSVWYALHAYDAQLRHTGMNANCSDIEVGIPDSYYTGDYGGFTSTPQVIVSYTGIKKLNISGCQAVTGSQNVSINLTIEYKTQMSSGSVSLNNVNITADALDIGNMVNKIQ